MLSFHYKNMITIFKLFQFEDTHNFCFINDDITKCKYVKYIKDIQACENCNRISHCFLMENLGNHAITESEFFC